METHLKHAGMIALPPGKQQQEARKGLSQGILAACPVEPSGLHPMLLTTVNVLQRAKHTVGPPHRLVGWNGSECIEEEPVLGGVATVGYRP